jgi:hypothetical protein
VEGGKARSVEVYIEAFEVYCDVLDQLSGHFKSLFNHSLHQLIKIAIASLALRIQPLLYGRTR